MYACSLLPFVHSVSTRISESLTHNAACQMLGIEDGTFKIIGSTMIEQRILLPASKISLQWDTIRHVKHERSIWNTTGSPMWPTKFSGKANLKSFAGPFLTLIHWLTVSSSPGSEIWFRNSLRYYSKSWPTSKSIFPSQAILLSYLYSLNIHSFSALAFLYFYLCLRLHKLKQSHTFKQTEKG